MKTPQRMPKKNTHEERECEEPQKKRGRHLEAQRPQQPEKRRGDRVGTHPPLAKVGDEALDFLPMGRAVDSSRH